MYEARRNYEQLVGNWWETYDELHCGWFFLCSTRENTTYLRSDVVCFYSGALPRPNEATWGGGKTIALHTDPFHQCRSTLSDPLFGVPLIAESFHFRQLAMTPWKFSNFFFYNKESAGFEGRGGGESKSPYKIDPVCPWNCRWRGETRELEIIRKIHQGFVYVVSFERSSCRWFFFLFTFLFLNVNWKLTRRAIYI